MMFLILTAIFAVGLVWMIARSSGSHVPHPHLTPRDVNEATQHLLDQISESLACGERVEDRGFGCFVLHYRLPRMSRNPKTGAPVALRAKRDPHFKAGKSLRERVNGNS